MTRFVVARFAETNESFWGPVTHPLPDAEHVHFTRLPDGTWSAVAMREAFVAIVVCSCAQDAWRNNPDPDCPIHGDDRPLWVDVEDGAR